MKQHIISMVTGAAGRISSARVVMVCLSIFSMVVLSLILHRQLTTNDPAMATAQASTLQWWGGTLLGLVTAPYAVGKFAGSITDLISAVRRGKD